jgi:hypothetical protein
MWVSWLVGLPIRFLALLEGKHYAPALAYLTGLREFDRIPNHIPNHILKAIKALIAERGTKKEIEPVEGPPLVITSL